MLFWARLVKLLVMAPALVLVRIVKLSNAETDGGHEIQRAAERDGGGDGEAVVAACV